MALVVEMQFSSHSLIDTIEYLLLPVEGDASEDSKLQLLVGAQNLGLFGLILIGFGNVNFIEGLRCDAACRVWTGIQMLLHHLQNWSMSHDHWAQSYL